MVGSGPCGESGDVANVTVIAEVTKSHLEEEEPLLSGVTATSIRRQR